MLSFRDFAKPKLQFFWVVTCFGVYSGRQMKFNSNNVSFNFSASTETVKKIQYTIEKPYKMVTKNAEKNLKFSTFVRFLGPFLEN